MKLSSKFTFVAFFISCISSETQSMELMTRCPILDYQFFKKNSQAFQDTPDGVVRGGTVRIDGTTWEVFNTFGEDGANKTFLEGAAKPNTRNTVRTFAITSRGRDDIGCRYLIFNEKNVNVGQVTLQRKRLNNETVVEGYH